MRSARRKTTGTPPRAAVPAGRQRMTIGELTRLRCPQPPRCTRHPLPQCGRGGTIAPAMVGEGSRGDELVPFADHIAVLVHDRIPHADPAHAVPERAAVAHRAGAFNLFAGRAEDVAFGRLAFHPEIPLVRAHLLFRSVEHGRVIALAVEKGARPAGQVPVDELVGGIEHRALQMSRQAEPGGPGAITLLQWLVDAGDTHLP